MDEELKGKVYINGNLITDVDEWERVSKNYKKLEKKAKAFDLICDHVEILNVLSQNVFRYTQMTKGEIEQVASALNRKITWVEKEESVSDTEVQSSEKKKKHWWSKN